MKKLENKLENLVAANKRLREAVTAYRSEPENTLYRDALIQRFEFTFELSWKAAAEVLRGQGIDIPVLSPKGVFKAAYAAGFIGNEDVWLAIIDDRNSMSHTYDEETSVRIADDICNRYAKETANLLKLLESNI